jgi:hypothetical protein
MHASGVWHLQFTVPLTPVEGPLDTLKASASKGELVEAKKAFVSTVSELEVGPNSVRSKTPSEQLIPRENLIHPKLFVCAELGFQLWSPDGAAGLVIRIIAVCPFMSLPFAYDARNIMN